MSAPIRPVQITVIVLIRDDEAAPLERSAYGTRQVDVLHGRGEVPDIRVLFLRQGEGQRLPISIRHHVYLGRQLASTPPQGMVYGFSLPPFLPPPEAAKRGANRRRIDHPGVQIYQSIFTQPQLEASENGLEGSIIAPLAEAVIDRLPGAVALRQIAPLAPEQRIQKMLFNT